MSTLRRTATISALLLGATLLAPTGSATAVGETCRGEAETIVGTGQSLQGTEGRDVIVSGSASTVNALGGDDLVCLTGTDVEYLSIRLDAGSGHDVVDATATTADQTYVYLGAGADAFYGGPQSDDVQASGYTADHKSIPDTERDVIDTGGGYDRVASTSAGVPNQDVIALGPDADHVFLEGPLAPGAGLDGGEGGDELAFITSFVSGDLAVDATSGTATLDGASWMRWSTMESYSLNLNQVNLDFTGTVQGEWLSVGAHGGSVTATMGEGNDRLTVFGSGLARLTLDGDEGNDTLEPIARTSMEVDLSADTLTWIGNTHAAHAFENVSAVGSNVRLIGDSRPNVLEAGPCVTRISGGGGADDISRRGEPAGDRIGVPCTKPKVVFAGGSGKDRLDGSRYADVLRGGPGNDRLIGRQGRDTGVGGPGRDRCSTEIRQTCERTG